MFEDFTENEIDVLRDKGFVIVEGVAKKSYDSAWETVRKIDQKFYHDGKDPYGSKFNKTYHNFDQWQEQQK